MTVKQYTQLQNTWIKQNNIKKGDRVKIIATGAPYMLGWDCGWTSEMSKMKGKIGIITDICTLSGFNITGAGDNDFWFPFCVLEKVKKVDVKVKINKDYTAVINDDGSVTVGCTTVPYHILDDIYTKACRAANED